ncbi:MAG: ThiF family adenylyltransferase [Chthoniobacteraceae bacterium]
MKEENFRPTSRVFYSAWDYNVQSEPSIVGHQELTLEIEGLLAGVGAVGCSFLHTLWATPGLSGRLSLLDNDPKGLEASNLNRYILFGEASIGLPKASTAASLLTSSKIAFEGFDIGIGEFQAVQRPNYIISAVDKNTPRHQIQVRYPARLFSASTSDLRAEVLRCGPPGIGACLACYNKEETVIGDEALRSKMINAPIQELQIQADRLGCTVEMLRKALDQSHCGEVGERVLAELRESSDPHQFSVGFVSVMAGVMLASAYLKDKIPNSTVLSDELQRAVFQFQNPLFPYNRAGSYGRDPSCTKCGPGPALDIWTKRFNTLKKPEYQMVVTNV